MIRIRKTLFLLILFFILTSVSYAGDRTNWSAWWNSLSRTERGLYLGGFNAGVCRVWYLVHEKKINVTSQDEKILLQQVFYDDELFDMPKILNMLYEDPANKYIDIGAMIYIAKAKLNGGQIEQMLLKARQMSQ